MANVILRQEAINDLNAIWEYTVEEWSEHQADQYYESLRQDCMEIGKNPGAGRTYFEIDERLLGFKSGRHIIFYQIISKDEIEVIRILHEMMDLKNRMKD